jgi:hypothetical protein
LLQVGIGQAAAVDARLWACALVGKEVWVTSGAVTVVSGEVSSYAGPTEGEMGGIVDAGVVVAVGEAEGGGYAGMVVLEVHVAVGPLQSALGNFPAKDSFAQIVGLELVGSWCDWEFHLECRYPKTWPEAYQSSGRGELKREQKEIGRLASEDYDPGEIENWENP